MTDSGIEMVLIPAGRFVMGCDGAAPEQGPAHAVDEQCEGRMVSVLEGGCHLESLADCVAAHLRNLME